MNSMSCNKFGVTNGSFEVSKDGAISGSNNLEETVETAVAIISFPPPSLTPKLQFSDYFRMV